ncbi:hypothetical protein GOBAR_AA28501 [Gossypium barbadense]|uniref:TIR domain-containing protein n=1 Tax=Gossypium barbadense TaxID=3634 RepID=A0A2P5WM63_GOSBA|nr:hypothetical protein GOBAR_AA28501 [Gossypium barbadense]
MKYHVFLSFRGEDTRLNFTSHLLQALKSKGIDVFFDEEKLEKGVLLSQALSRAIAVSNISIIVLSADYASSKSCLVELSDIKIRKRSHGHTVIPIFYHVDPSNVRNIGGSFETSFEEHESKQATDTVQRWKSAFAEIGTLKGWHIEEGKFDSASKELVGIEYQKNAILKLIKQNDCRVLGLWGMGGQGKTTLAEVVYKKISSEFESHCFLQNVREEIGNQGKKSLRNELLSKLLNSKVDIDTPSIGSTLTQETKELVGIEYQKNAILKLIKQNDCRVLGLWGMGGQGKTTLAEVVYKKISSEFESHCFLQNVREEIGNQGKKSLRNELLSKLLNSKVDIDTPSIGSTLTQERLNKKKVLVVLDDVDDHLDQIDYMGVKYFGFGSKTIITSRDRQVLESGGADKIHEVKRLNENDSLQLFSTFAFKQLNPAVGFQDLSRRFVKYTQGNPLALKVLGSDLNKRSIDYWESKVEKLKDCPPEKKISEALKSSYDGLDIVEQNIFLDIACFFKGEPIERTKHILSGCYKGVECGINKLVDKCLISVSSSRNFSLGFFGYCTTRHLEFPYIIDMHDTLEEMAKDIVCQESKNLGKCSRLWNLKHVEEVLKYNKGTDRIQGIKLDISRVDNLLFQPFVFKNMTNLRYIFFYLSSKYLLREESEDYKKLLTYQDDIVSLPNELRYLQWEYYPFKALSSSFNLKNLVALKLPRENMEQLWNEGHQKIPNLLGALNLERLDCKNCRSLVKLPSLAHLTSLKTLHLKGCRSLKKFPEIPNNFDKLDLSETGIKKVPDFIERLDRLRRLTLTNSMVKYVSSNISKLKSLEVLDLGGRPIVKSPEIPRSLTGLYLSGTQIKEVDLSSNSRAKDASSNISKLESLYYDGCPIVKFSFPTVDVPSPSLKDMYMDSCKSLNLLSELPPYLDRLDFDSFGELVSMFDSFVELVSMLFCNCFNLNQESTNNIEANAMLKIGSLAKIWAARQNLSSCRDSSHLICCFPGNKISANKFKCQSMNSSLSLKIAPNGGSGSGFLVFAICLVADLTHCRSDCYVECICEYQLTATDGGNGGGGYEKLRSTITLLLPFETEKYKDYHVFILSTADMVKKDQNYEEASFEFSIRNLGLEGDDVDMKVERCGVHVFYVDEESDTDYIYDTDDSSTQSHSNLLSPFLGSGNSVLVEKICNRSQNLWDKHMELEATFDSFHAQARLGSVVDIIQLNCLGSTIGANAIGSK